MGWISNFKTLEHHSQNIPTNYGFYKSVIRFQSRILKCKSLAMITIDDDIGRIVMTLSWVILIVTYRTIRIFYFI
jgi:hypothetical protein